MMTHFGPGVFVMERSNFSSILINSLGPRILRASDSPRTKHPRQVRKTVFGSYHEWVKAFVMPNE